MARKSNLQIAGESALANLNAIHDLAIENAELGGRKAEVYVGNAHNCARWCAALKAAGMPWPQWMIDGNLRYFAAMWGFRPD